MSTAPDVNDDAGQLKRALVALKKLRAKLDTIEQARTEPVAIIGIGCRLPGGVNSPAAYWHLLRNGLDAISEVPAERWNAAAFFDPDEAPGTVRTPYGAFIQDVDQFDPHFFGIAPREAASMDPQQRIVLEVAWAALEDAGLVPARLAGSRTGVFVGIGLNDYSRLQVPDQTLDPGLIDNYFTSGNALCITPNRLSYLLDLRGPSLAIDSACSSSLAAIHVACQSLRSGESTLALAGGVNLILAPATSISLTKFLAPDGRCKTFDARADGYARGEGAIVIVLKLLSKAVADGDSIYAVIRGSAVNQDGFSSGLTVPNGVAQQAMLREALANAGVRPEQIDYVEAHGTGTSLGDPIEANALGEVLGRLRTAGHYLAIGSVKTNIGHLEAGAGIAGLVKVALALKHGELPPSLNYTSPNPHIPFDELHLRVQTRLTPWPRRDHPPLAGVSSFGFGGTNAHAILQAPPDREVKATHPVQPVQLLTLSAKTDQALRELAQRYADQFDAQPSLAVADVCYSANTGRSVFAHRAASVAESLAQLQTDLAAFARGEETANVIVGQVQRSAKPKIAWLFTGQGAQYIDMGRQLYETQPTFRAALDRCDAILRPYFGKSLLSVIYPDLAFSDRQHLHRAADAVQVSAINTQPSTIDQTAFTQPALFAIEYALAELWKSWGIEPAAVLGHSVGEYMAACVAGVFSLEDGLKLIAARGRLMQQLPAGGAMAAVFATEAVVRAACAPYSSTVSFAAINGPDNSVISGVGADVQAVVDQLHSQGIKSRRLIVSHAFHSHLMDPMLDEFEQVARTIEFHAPRLPLISNVTGRVWQPGEVPDARYWRDHIRAAVRFADGIETLHQQGFELYLEIGPNPTLIGMAQRCVPEGAGVWLASLRSGQSDWRTLLKSAGTLFAQGVAVDWSGLDGEYTRQRVSLPTYPFQHERYWFAAGSRTSARRLPGASAIHPLLGSRLRSPAIKGSAFETPLSVADWPLLGEHRVYGTPVFPATAYVELVLAAARETFGEGVYALEELVIQHALTVPDDETRTVQVVLSPAQDGLADFQVFSAADSEWQLHMSGNLRLSAGLATPVGTLEGARLRCLTDIAPARFYERIAERGLEYGPHFQSIRRLTIDPQRTEVVAQIQLADDFAADTEAYRFHPAVLDACWQAIGAAFLIESDPNGDAIYLPIGCDCINVLRSPAGEVWSHATVLAANGTNREIISADLHVFDASDQLIAEVRGLHFKRAPREALLSRPVNFDDWLYQIEWRSALPGSQPVTLANSAWLIYADEHGAAMELSRQLQARGADCVLVQRGDESITPALLARSDWRGILHLWSLDGGRAAADHSGRSVLHLVQALAQMKQPPRLWLVTRGAQSVRSGEDVAIDQAPLWGLAATITLEQPELHCACIDLDPSASVDQAAQALLSEMTSTDSEDRIAYRGGDRFVARLTRHTARTAQQAAPSAVQLAIPSRGLLDNLTLQPVSRRTPGHGEVEIRVRATGLNFRDVLNALGMYPGDAGAPGSECAGEIVSVGDGVDHLHAGDEVLAAAAGSFSTYAITRAEFVAPKPPTMTFDEAATLPIAFLTAQYGLHQLAQLSKGDRVLIHAAAGGVGLAAVQIAQRAGAEIFGTAGSPEKRAYLHSIGVPHVLDSRTLSFADDITRLTNGEGVDIILNSLAGDFITQSVSVLKPHGCFLEIGKRDIWSAGRMAQARPGAAYHVYDLGAVMRDDPALIQALLRELMQSIARGELKPLPLRVFALTDAVEAFRFMERARHIGKIVVSQPADRSSHPIAIRADGTYLITGGLGGLGLQAAGWLVEQGARHVILMGRHAPSSAAQTAINTLEQQGAHVIVAQADVSQADQVAAILSSIDPATPLRGIVHTAGIIDDGVLVQQTWERFEAVAAPKAGGAWQLHALTQNYPLDFFVLFSSIASVLGSAGQGNYAAANAALDALAQHRHAHGLPALSVNWGAWSDVGMFAALSDHDRGRRLTQGLRYISPAQGWQVLTQLLQSDAARNAAQLMVLPIDWRQYDTRPPLFAEIRSDVKPIEPAARSAAAMTIVAKVQAAPINQRRSILSNHVREHAINVLGLSASYPIDPRQPLSELGLDSLMAVELRNALGTGFARSLPATLLFDYPTIDGLVDFLTKEFMPVESQPVQSGVSEQRAVPSSATDLTADLAMADLATLSEDEAEALLLQELASGQQGRRNG
ncbi:MAG: type I polyketide synthase [Chloroflexi bacterium]|nr:type I polyketide synthase [Chloroflexota bacterium]